jgi:hypothetical protein
MEQMMKEQRPDKSYSFKTKDIWTTTILNRVVQGCRIILAKIQYNGRRAMRTIVLFLFSLVLIVGMGISPAQALAPVYLGQTSWTMYITNDTFGVFMVGQSVTLTGGLTKLGDNYYAFEGYIGDYFTSTHWPNISPSAMILSGGGTLINGKLMLTLNNSTPQLTDGGRYTGVMNVSLDTASGNYLNGNFSQLTSYLVINASVLNNFVFAGTMTRTGNAIPLAPSSLAPLYLLLN